MISPFVMVVGQQVDGFALNSVDQTQPSGLTDVIHR